MHKNSVKKNAFSPLTQKIKSSQHFLRFQDKQNELDDEEIERIHLPSLPRQKSWKNDDCSILSNGNSAGTSVSLFSQRAEDATLQKVEEHWVTLERSLYEEDNQLPYGPPFEECMQWRTQIPYLRIIGKGPICTENNGQDDASDEKTKELQSEEILMECDSMKIKEEEKDSLQCKLDKATFETVLDILMEHVITELFPSKENDTDSLCESLSSALKIAPAPVHANRNSSKSSRASWAEEAVSQNYIENKSLSIRNRLLDTENSFKMIKDDVNYQAVQKKTRNSVSANKQRNLDTEDDGKLRAKQRLCTPHVGRNKLGTIFNEKIVVSPVPFAISTRQSFSTLKTMPVRVMGENLEISSFQEPVRNISDFRNSMKISTTLRNSNIHSAWQAPVCPTIWPKNIRLAPIDASRFPSSKNRSLAPSPAIFHCSRRPLDPISRSIVPRSAHATCNNNDPLEIQGQHIVPQSSKINALSAGWNHSPRVVKSKKKKVRSNEGV